MLPQTATPSTDAQSLLHKTQGAQWREWSPSVGCGHRVKTGVCRTPPPHGVGVLQAGEWDGVHLTISVLPFYFSSLVPAHLLYSLLPPD